MLFSDRLEHFLRRRRLARELLLLPSGVLGFLHAAKFLGGVFQTQVGVGVECDTDVAVAHQVLHFNGSQRMRVYYFKTEKPPRILYRCFP